MTWVEAAARWYGLLLLISLAWAPWVRLLCPGLADRGASIVRPVALLALVYPAWLLSSISSIPFTNALLWAVLAIATVSGWTVVLRRGLIDRGWVLALVSVEAIGVAAFAGYIWLRGFTPAILFTEKPMESAFLMSSSITNAMPPADPWFVGQPINYYFLGYVVQGALSRLAGIPGTTGFNLALATTFSMAVVAAAGVAWNVVRRWHGARLATAAAVIAILVIMLSGNLYAAGQVVQTRDETQAASWWDKQVGVGWRASRIVCDTERVDNDCAFPHETINEFPSFSFILGDLHPHVLALPFTLTALVLAFSLLTLGRERFSKAASSPALSRATWVRIGVTGALVGSLYALNSWDLPIYLLIAAFAAWWAFGRDWRPVVLVVVAAVAAWSPFYLRYAPPTGGGTVVLPEALSSLPVLPRLFSTIAIHTGERTSTGEFLTMFGLPYVFALWLIFIGLLREERTPGSLQIPTWAVAGAILAGISAILLAAPLVLVCGLPLVGALLVLRREPNLGARAIATFLYALGFILVIGTEFVFIQDVFGTRMNTLFKFYYQVWVLFGLATALAFAVIWCESRLTRITRPALLGLTVAGLVAGLVYPALSARAWTEEFADWSGLDGIAFIAELSPDELAAIRWLQDNATADDVLLEAAGCSYEINGGLALNRASAFSGVPTVIGWSGHEQQWRSGQPELLAEIPRREAEVAEMLTNPTSELFDRYGVTLMYVGQFERGEWRHICPVAGPYPGVNEPGYPGPGWEQVFTQGDVSIFRRTAAGSAAEGK